MDGYSADLNWSNYTPLDSTGSNYDIFKSAYKDIRFNVPVQSQYQLTATDMTNLPGMAYNFFGDTSLWRALMAFNGISDPISEVAVGMTINIPQKASLQTYLSSQLKQQQQQTSVTI